MSWQALPVEVTLRVLETLDPLSLVILRKVTFHNTYPLPFFLTNRRQVTCLNP